MCLFSVRDCIQGYLLLLRCIYSLMNTQMMSVNYDYDLIIEYFLERNYFYSDLMDAVVIY